MWEVLSSNDTNQTTVTWINMGESQHYVEWKKQDTKSIYWTGIYISKKGPNTYDVRTQSVVPHGREYGNWKEAQDIFTGCDAFLFWIWFPTRSVFTLRILIKLYMMIYVYFNKRRENILLREFYSHNEKNTCFCFFFPVKEWEKSTEIAHLRFASLKGILNNLENTPWNFGI